MIPARRSAWFTRWFAERARRRIQRAFAEMRVRGLAGLRSALARGPVLVVSNHTAWWDPLVTLVVCAQELRADAYAMMDAGRLRELPFFARVGAFGVALDDPADGARAIRYAAKRLDRPGRLVWIFPQGREAPVTARPLGFRAGAAEVARLARRACVVPIALRYEHGEAPRPVVWIAIGEARHVASAPRRTAESVRQELEGAVTAELDRVDAALVHGRDEGFEVLLRGRESFWARMPQTLLAWATRPRRRLGPDAQGARSTVP